MKQWIGILALVCTIAEIRTAECRVSCIYLSYSNGFYDGSRCLCVDVKNYNDIVKKEFTPLPKKIEQPTRQY